MTIFENISSLCKQNGMSISRLERELELGNATIRNWDGQSSPTLSKIKSVADFFGVPIDYLVAGHPDRGSPIKNQIHAMVDGIQDEEYLEFLNSLILAFKKKWGV